MIRCESCNKVTKANRQTYIAVLEERNKEYYKYILNKSHKKLIIIDPSQKIVNEHVANKYKITNKLKYKGKEIVKTIKICRECTSKFKKVL